MLESKANVCASAFVDGAILEEVKWFVEERTFTTDNGQLCETGARKITKCDSDVVLPPGANLILVIRVSGTPSDRVSPTILGSDNIRKWFTTRIPTTSSPRFSRESLGSREAHYSRVCECVTPGGEIHI